MLLCVSAFAQGPVLTTVAYTYARPDGSLPSGTISIMNPPFTSPDGFSIAAANKTMQFFTGAISVQLVPTQGGSPDRQLYTVLITPQGNPMVQEFWSVPQSAGPVNHAAVISYQTPLPNPLIGIPEGGTGASTAAQARANLGITSGSVTGFSAGNLLPLFNSSVATASSTPALTFSLLSADPDSIFGNFSGATAPPAYGGGLITCGDSTHALGYLNHVFECQSLSTGTPLPPGVDPLATDSSGAPIASSILTNVKSPPCLAKGDGIQDDTLAIQTCLNLFTAGRSAIASGSIFFPIGKYKITAPLYYFGSAGFPITLSGSLGGWNNTNPESVIVWGGAAGGTMLEMMGAGAWTIRDMNFDQAVTARIGIHIASDNAWNTTLGTAVPTPGSATVTPASMDSIAAGTLLSIDTGASLELVYVTAITPTTFTATFTKAHLATAHVGGSAGSSGGRMRDVYIVGVPDSTTDWGTSPATATAGLVIGNVTSRATAQVSEIKAYDLFIYDNDTNGTASACIVFPEGGNAKNYWLYTPICNRFQYGIDARGGPNPLVIFGGDMAGIRTADFRLASSTTTIIGVEDESDSGHRFVESPAVGNNAANLTLIGNSFQTSAPADDYVVQWYGSLVMEGNQWENLRTPTSVAKMELAATLFPGYSGQVDSRGNFFMNALAGYAPFYDSGGNSILPGYYNNQPVKVTSLGDYGGQAGSLIGLNNYLTASALTSQTAPYVASTGVVRAGDTDCAVAFRNHANTGDVDGICKTADDVTHLGGAAGIAFQGPVPSASLPTGLNTFFDISEFPAANCVNTVPGSFLSSTSTGMPAACRGGSNNLSGVLQPIPNAGGTAYFDYEIPGDWPGLAQKPTLGFYYGAGANTSGTVIGTFSTACSKADGTTTDDPAWIAESAMSAQTMASANRSWAQEAQMAGAMTNCVGGGVMHVKLDVSGTASSAINVSMAKIVTPRMLATATVWPTWALLNNAQNIALASPTVTTPFSSSLTPGSIILVGVQQANSGAIATPTDTATNTYFDAGPDVVHYSSGNYGIELFYALNTHSTASNVISVANAGLVDTRIHASEWTGGYSANPIDVYASASGLASTGTDNISSGAAATSSPGDLIFGFGNGRGYPVAVGTGFTAIDSWTNTIDEYLIQSLPASVAATLTGTPTDPFAMIMVALRAKPRVF
jgi:hypothetical protein